MSWRKLLSLLLGIVSVAGTRAQFTPGILANESYWGDGKAEFDIYDAQLMRGGEARHCEVLHILSREAVDPMTFARIDKPTGTEVMQAVRMQQIWTAPIGLFVEQGALTSQWSPANGALLTLNYIGADSFGNSVKQLAKKNDAYELFSATYRDAVSTIPVSLPAKGIFYDELPLRVRTIDFTKAPAEFAVELAPSLVAARKSNSVAFAPAKLSWKPAEKTIEVLVQHEDGSDRFLLDREFPFLLREWDGADGSKLKLKRGLKADYWHYSRNGDRERALKNPMLEHPD